MVGKTKRNLPHKKVSAVQDTERKLRSESTYSELPIPHGEERELELKRVKVYRIILSTGSTQGEIDASNRVLRVTHNR